MVYKFYKGNKLNPEFGEDPVDKDLHICNCHWEDWCTCGSNRIAEKQKAREAEGMDLRRKEVIERHEAKKKEDVTDWEDNIKTQECPDEACEVKEEPKAVEIIKEEMPEQITALDDVNRDLPPTSRPTKGGQGVPPDHRAAQGPQEDAAADPPTSRHQD